MEKQSFNKDGRTKNVTRNASSAFINKIAILFLSFIQRKFFIQFIGVSYLGISGLFANILTLLSMADLGLGVAMNVSLYKPVAENDTKKLAAYLGYYKKLYRYIASAVFTIGCALIPFLKYIINLEQDIPHIYLYYILFVLKSAVSYLFVYKSSIIRADQRTYLVNRIEIYVTIAKTIIEIICIWAFKLYIVYLLLEIAGVIAHNIIVSVVADRHYPFIKQSVTLSGSEKKEVFTNMTSMFVYKVSKNLITGTDSILISIICGTVFVGLYSNYLTITDNIIAYVALLFSALTASVGNLVATTGPEKRYTTFKTMQMVSFWLCGIVSICLFLLTEDFITIWLGKDMVLDSLTLVAIVFNTYFSLCMHPVWSFREGTGMYNQIKYVMLITAILNLVLSIILGKMIGLSGIIFATSLSKLLTNFWYEPNILFKQFFHVKPYKYYLGYLENIFMMGVCFALCYFATIWIKEMNIIFWVIKGLICFAIINLVYFLRYRKTSEFKEIVSIGKRIVKRK